MTRVALVTGSARRVGRSMIEALASWGYTAWVHYRGSAEAAEEVAHGIDAQGGIARTVKADVGTAEGCAQLISRVAAVDGRLDVLVNNVGIYPIGPLVGYARADFERVLSTNLLGPFDLIQRALPLFPAEGGSIVNLGMTGLEFTGAAGKATAYNCSKAGLLILTRSFAEVLGPRGVRVNMISPGHVDFSVDLPDDFADEVPLRRPATVADLCGALRYLISPEAGYVTGQNIEVAGGYMLSLRPDR